MKRWRRLLLGVAAFAVLPAAAQSQRQVSPNHPEMSAIFAADQAPRKAPAGKVDWATVPQDDQKRRHRTRFLIESRQLKTADDFFHAALVMQHGGTPQDFILAHTLATISAVRGHPKGIWLSAATFDRYLHTVGHSQVYGTQFITVAGKPTTQEPYDRTVISDPVLRELGLPDQAEQAAGMAAMSRMSQEMLKGTETKPIP